MSSSTAKGLTENIVKKSVNDKLFIPPYSFTYLVEFDSFPNLLSYLSLFGSVYYLHNCFLF